MCATTLIREQIRHFIFLQMTWMKLPNFSLVPQKLFGGFWASSIKGLLLLYTWLFNFKIGSGSSFSWSSAMVAADIVMSRLDQLMTIQNHFKIRIERRYFDDKSYEY
ncbi:hypothetical protein LAZ67_X001950 [Cordylochernes scorpioides]|uniref:Uncharacterized protein n=1 Tax=Cordylochernes scorpioides TaxID=51811 RepID=A0ABY6LTE6_9ARAC|nr:hypothetical protein LAZ67_X001950 [Cordylochernes scorpioides]